PLRVFSSATGPRTVMPEGAREGTGKLTVFLSPGRRRPGVRPAVARATDIFFGVSVPSAGLPGIARSGRGPTPPPRSRDAVPPHPAVGRWLMTQAKAEASVGVETSAATAGGAGAVRRARSGRRWPRFLTALRRALSASGV